MKAWFESVSTEINLLTDARKPLTESELNGFGHQLGNKETEEKEELKPTWFGGEKSPLKRDWNEQKKQYREWVRKSKYKCEGV